ncbi:MAG: hypothetical protein FJX46_12945, partial [Alphaproteobacteria bacterium]|nr:hypothetical protein [Alphaproteobacteria bacterium]
MNRIAPLLAALAALALQACTNTANRTLSAITDQDCDVDRLITPHKVCRPVQNVVQRPLYCYKTIGVMNCYATPDPFIDPLSPVQVASLPVNTIPAGSYGSNGPSVANPEARVAAQLAALQAAEIEAQRQMALEKARQDALEAIEREVKAREAALAERLRREQAERDAANAPPPPPAPVTVVPTQPEEAKKPPPRRPARRTTSTNRPRPLTS